MRIGVRVGVEEDPIKDELDGFEGLIGRARAML